MGSLNQVSQFWSVICPRDDKHPLHVVHDGSLALAAREPTMNKPCCRRSPRRAFLRTQCRPLDSNVNFARDRSSAAFYSLRRGRTRKIECRLVGDILTIIHRLVIGTRQVGARRCEAGALGRAFQFDDDVALLARRHAGDINV